MGYITSFVSSQMPQKDNESNYLSAEDLPYPYARWNHAEYGEVYIIQCGDSWHILLPEDYPVN